MQLLGVKPQTLYAYVSRGHVRSVDAGKGTRARLYRREDVERMRTRSQARAGHGPVAAAALRWGEPVLDTKIGTVDARGPIYRGRPACELAQAGATFEAVCVLLWGCADGAPDDVPAKPTFGVDVVALAKLVPRGGRAFEAMLLAAAALAAQDDGATPELLVRRLVAAAALPRGPKAVELALAEATIARNFLRGMVGKPTIAGAEQLVDKTFVVCADHELNVSTFATRVAASTDASLVASVVAGMAALSGPRHGAATSKVEALVEEIGVPERAAAVVAQYRDRGEAVPGFGHPLYPSGDPRGAFLLAECTRMTPDASAVRVLVAVTHAMRLAARESPTLDVGLVAVAAALGLPRGGALALFACGRLAGWIAHALEQRAEGHLLRPRARYLGP